MADDIATEAVYSDDSATSSPKHKLKFLCSYGGKILPRSPDGQLKYTGGETRVVSIPKDINFSDLKKKLCDLTNGDMVLKYQVTPEDLDALVTVRSDEDIKHMLEEYHRHEHEGAPKFRAFLFPSSPVVLENPTFLEPHAIEQRYIDAINGILRKGRVRPVRTNRPMFSISSCSSPGATSPENKTTDNNDAVSLFDNKRPMHRVRSSPSICGLNQNQLQSHPYMNQHVLGYHQSHHNHHQNGHHFSKPPQDPHLGTSGPDRSIMSPLSFHSSHSRAGTSPLSQGLNSYYSPSRYYGESGGFSPRRYFYDKHTAYSAPLSPRKAF